MGAEISAVYGKICGGDSEASVESLVQLEKEKRLVNLYIDVMW